MAAVKSMTLNSVEFKVINTKNIITNPAYQRPADTRRSKRISEKLDWEQLGVPAVCRAKKRGMWEAPDGQHRINAVKEKYPEGREILCMVIKNRHGFEYFTQQNQERRAIRPNDVWWANYNGLNELGDTESKYHKLKNTMDKCGIKLMGGCCGKVKSTECIHVATLQKMHDDIGEKSFLKIMPFIVDRFSGDGRLMSASFIQGLAKACVFYGHSSAKKTIEKIIFNVKSIEEVLKASHIIDKAKRESVSSSSAGVSDGVRRILLSEELLNESLEERCKNLTNFY